MLPNRLELRKKLRTVLGNDNTYFQPPENVKMSYPCVVYSFEDFIQRYANNRVYQYDRRYTVTFISYDPDNLYYEGMINNFDHVEFDRRFVADNLYHDVFTVYF